MKSYNNNAPIEWKGNLEDDCSAQWNGLLLRAEKMQQASWWWAVAIQTRNGIEIDSANNYSHRVPTGIAARGEAERVARAYILTPKSSLSAPEKLKVRLKKFFPRFKVK